MSPRGLSPARVEHAQELEDDKWDQRRIRMQSLLKDCPAPSPRGALLFESKGKRLVVPRDVPHDERDLPNEFCSSQLVSIFDPEHPVPVVNLAPRRDNRSDNMTAVMTAPRERALDRRVSPRLDDRNDCGLSLAMPAPAVPLTPRPKRLTHPSEFMSSFRSGTRRNSQFVRSASVEPRASFRQTDAPQHCLARSALARRAPAHAEEAAQVEGCCTQQLRHSARHKSAKQVAVQLPSEPPAAAVVAPITEEALQSRQEFSVAFAKRSISLISTAASETLESPARA